MVRRDEMMGQSVRDGLEKAAKIVDAAAERYQKIADVNRQEHGYSGVVAVLKETAKSIRDSKGIGRARKVREA